MLLICDAKIKQFEVCVAPVETRKSQGFNESRNRTSEDLIVGGEEARNFKNRQEYTENAVNIRQMLLQVTTALSRLTHLNMLRGGMYKIHRSSSKVLKSTGKIIHNRNEVERLIFIMMILMPYL